VIAVITGTSFVGQQLITGGDDGQQVSAGHTGIK